MGSGQQKIHYLCLEPLREGHAAYTHVMEIAGAIQKQGFEVTIFYPTYSNRSSLPGLGNRLKGILKTQIRLMRSSSTSNLVYIRWHPLSFFTALWCRFHHKPVIQEVNGPYEDFFISWGLARYFKRIFTYMFRKQLCWAGHIIVVTPGLKGFVEREAGHSRVTVIENGANIHHFIPDHQTNRELPVRFVTFYGTFSKWYNLSLLLEATQHTLWPKDVKLVIAGDGQGRPIVEAMCGKAENILYLGRLPYKDIPGVISKALACLIPTKNVQGRADTGLSPLKMYESLACGVPVVVSDLPGQADFIRKHRCGLVVQGHTPEAWAKCVQELSLDPKKRSEMTLHAREIIVQNYSWESKAKETAEIIQSLL